MGLLQLLHQRITNQENKSYLFIICIISSLTCLLPTKRKHTFKIHVSVFLLEIISFIKLAVKSRESRDNNTTKAPELLRCVGISYTLFETSQRVRHTFRRQPYGRGVLCVERDLPVGWFWFPSKLKLRGFGPWANYTDRATAASWRS
jgi:hypothetical protein